MVKLVSERAGRPPPTIRRGRKVRAPQDRVIDSIDRPQGSGKCNRKQTAVAEVAPRETEKATAAVRVKRCGKSAPAAGATRLAWQTPPGARPSRTSALRAQARGARAGPARCGVRVGCWRRRATGVLEKWPSP